MDTTELARMSEEVVLEVLRETSTNRLNRFCRDPKTHVRPFDLIIDIQEIMYHCESQDNKTLVIRRGGKHGKIIAYATQCLEKDGVTDIHLLEPKKCTIQLEHDSTINPFFHGKAGFRVNGKSYHWKGHTALIEDGTGILIAALHTRFVESDPYKLGTFVVTLDGKEILDLVVVTCLVMQERSEEGKLSVHSLLFKLADNRPNIGCEAYSAARGIFTNEN